MIIAWSAGERLLCRATLPLTRLSYLFKEALNDPDEQVRRKAIESLGRLTFAEIDLLISSLSEGDWDSRRNAAITLGQLGRTEAIPVLVKALADEDWRVRRGAAISLGQLGEQSLGPLVAAVNNNEAIINNSLAFTLRMIGTPKALRLLKLLGYEK